jgi:hypothetical protein
MVIGIMSELTLRIAFKFNPLAPFWLLQGVSAYESNWQTKESLVEAISSLKDQLNVNTILRISTDDEQFKAQYGYELTYTVIEYIVDCFGKKSLISYLKTPESLFSIFECSEEQFWKSWLYFVRERYLGIEKVCKSQKR